ncbi:MAG: polyhydroxyalkanoic acid synthase [Hydrogenophaga sp.]|uniref:PHA/PHB synthase family protein n=1 Tax=Hydrogenophaga sp. TaxID=1904254 RepID=UPI001D428773|nr:alpha/beta fold hydrolase [Hydrogenophaga sp.]MBX3611068.1 polyhydroxyalkanoic acid synthase [Hydrogenophaga sp.]
MADLPTAPDTPHALDCLREAWMARATGGLSPESLALAWADWAMHLAGAPGKRLALLTAMTQSATAFACGEANPDLARDPRFRADAWQQHPWLKGMADAFLRTEAWWRAATHNVPGTAPHSEAVTAFACRQLLDMWSPSNLPWLNPEVIDQTRQQQGLNLWNGLNNAWEDTTRRLSSRPPAGTETFEVGRNLACTPGKVVMRNRLVELIQYSPTTDHVKAEPVLIVPAWIMKYYILDLSPQNSMVRWLVEQGHTVFCLSWRNVGEAERDLGMDDYRQEGVMAALDAVNAIVPRRKVHAVGYCLGGTLLTIAAAAMARAGDERLASMSLFAAQTDFTEPGELGLFIDPAQLHMLDSMMWQRGYLTADQMAGAFQMLQSNDLVWSRAVHDYLMGERAPMIDLMAWNADATRMPFRMHSQYLHRLFLDNDLASGRYVVDGHPVALQDLKLPIFLVGTERDHVAPWHSVYKLHQLTDTELCFVLTNGGHNAGIVNEPGHPHRHYRLATRMPGDLHQSADDWEANHVAQEGSWWPAWHDWLSGHGSPRAVRPPSMGARTFPPLADAPGSYVLER